MQSNDETTFNINAYNEKTTLIITVLNQKYKTCTASTTCIRTMGTGWTTYNIKVSPGKIHSSQYYCQLSPLCTLGLNSVLL